MTNKISYYVDIRKKFTLNLMGFYIKIQQVQYQNVKKFQKSNQDMIFLKNKAQIVISSGSM